MSNILSISLNRSAVLSLTTLQHDNLTPLKVVLWEGVADSFGAGPEVYVDFKQPDGTTLYRGPFALVEEINITITNSILAQQGMLYAQVRIKDDTGYEWRSSQAYADIAGSIYATDPATPDDRIYVETPASFTEGNHFILLPSGRLIDLANQQLSDILKAKARTRADGNIDERGYTGIKPIQVGPV